MVQEGALTPITSAVALANVGMAGRRRSSALDGYTLRPVFGAGFLHKRCEPVSIRILSRQRNCADFGNCQPLLLGQPMHPGVLDGDFIPDLCAYFYTKKSWMRLGVFALINTYPDGNGVNAIGLEEVKSLQ